jgi:three-Cys-motif partner protein
VEGFVMAEKFFDEREDQSEVKARIVSKYFFAWANVVKGAAGTRVGRIAYIDLFCGPGRYKDGAKSTPIMIVEKAIRDGFLRDHLVTLFNDENSEYTDSLEGEFNIISGIEKLKYKPNIMTGDVGESLSGKLSEIELIPSFSFIDPFGYKGLSLRLIQAAIKDWGCDCVFFFNYNRINAGISNELVDSHMNALFGEERAEALRVAIEGKEPTEREALILENLALAIRELGGKYVLPFRFRNSRGTRSTHHLVFVSKHVKGYEIMKEIMAGESSTHDQGVPSLEYSPADASTPLLFSLNRSRERLAADLLRTFSGRQLKMIDVYNEHHIDTPFIRANYKQALLDLEKDGKISTNPSGRRKGTFADHVQVAFPNLKDSN